MEIRNQNSKFGVFSVKKSVAVAGMLLVTTLGSAFATGMAPAQAGYNDYNDDYPSYQYQPTGNRRAPVRTVRVTAPTAVIIRSGPGLNYERIGRIPNGHDVRVSYSSGNWAKLVGGPGWIHSDYISGVGGRDRVYTVRVNAPVGVVIRSGPGSNYARIGSIRHGQYIKVSYSSGDWVKLVGQRGWVHADYLD
ncbi:SH3 domain-containing protein [Scytonema sp. NUACC26]|uniref:SH3 domain-containing protein n=1 Tax=Scytonema sp. NUACC26 TaxID=3140176 RepID=UPI0034DBF6F1